MFTVTQFLQFSEDVMRLMFHFFTLFSQYELDTIAGINGSLGRFCRWKRRNDIHDTQPQLNPMYVIVYRAW